MATRKKDEHSFRLHPKLRVIRNGDDEVNSQRAMRSCTLASMLPPSDTKDASAGEAIAPAPRRRKTPKPRRLKMTDERAAQGAFVNIFVEMKSSRNALEGTLSQSVEAMKAMLAYAQKDSAAAVLSGTRLVSSGNAILATVPVSLLSFLEKMEGVSFIQSAEPIRLDQPAVDPSGPCDAPPAPRLDEDPPAPRSPVLIGIIDVGGFDFAHPDFMKRDGTSRFVRIWDQGGSFRAPPDDFGYGAEFTQERLNSALAAAKSSGLPATRLEQQSQRDTGSHGTHVASIAGGNRGVCPHAMLAGVVISLAKPTDDNATKRTTFSDSSRIVDAVAYLTKLAEDLKVPISINISLGANGGAHDGSSATARWLEGLLGAPGVAISIAGGNAGQIESLAPGDLGWMFGRVHAMGRIPSRGLQHELDWVVAGDGVVDASENELEIWYGAQDRIAIKLQPPHSRDWITVRPGEFIENRALDNGTFLSVYNELYHPANGANYVALYLSPNLKTHPITGVTAGTWRVRLVGEEIRDGNFHAWIERDDPQPYDPDQPGVFYFPSYFSARSAVGSHTINTLACSNSVVAVANIDALREVASHSSSPGPTRDGRLKPDIGAPGTSVVAAYGFGDRATPWIAMTGTSMASPHIAGVIAWMLAMNPRLTSAQCQGILQRTSQPLVGTSYEWSRLCGFGNVNAGAAIREAASFNSRLNLG
jgi:subtilisin family serine protease